LRSPIDNDREDRDATVAGQARRVLAVFLAPTPTIREQARSCAQTRSRRRNRLQTAAARTRLEKVPLPRRINPKMDRDRGRSIPLARSRDTTTWEESLRFASPRGRF